MTALIDTGFLLAVLDADDELHDICTLALEEEREPALPDMVIPELAYLVLRELGHPALITVDRRDFQMFRPKHCPAFEIIP
jgi:predicted nucleic acid-binding protein